MSRKVYFYVGKDEKVYTGRDIAQAAKLVHNMDLRTKDDLDEYIKLRCCGVLKELKNVSVETFVKMGESIKAAVLYKELNDCSIKEATEYVERLEETLKGTD